MNKLTSLQPLPFSGAVLGQPRLLLNLALSGSLPICEDQIYLINFLSRPCNKFPLIPLKFYHKLQEYVSIGLPVDLYFMNHLNTV